MTAMHLLPLLVAVAQIGGDAPPRREPPVRYGPCGVYDIAELADHFLVEVDQQPAEYDPKLVTITISLIEKVPEGDGRQPLPIEGLAVQVRDEANNVIASSPLHWEPSSYTLTSSKPRLARITISPKAAKQTILNREPILRWLDQPHLLVTFKSLAPK